MADNLELVVHRIVHGGERFTAPTRLDPSTIAALEAITPLTPLHNGPALALAAELQQALVWLQPFELHQIPADEEGLMARQCQQAASSGPSQAWRPVSPSHQE